jgi:hypothetical protein
MPSIQDDQAHALLIGVDDYTSFESSGQFDLKGSRNDVLLLASYCVEVLGLRPENIVALTWPQLTEQDFEQHVSMRGAVLGDAVRKIVVGEATEAEVTRRLASLLDVSQRGTALLTFSGHGAATDEGPVLCLGDTAPGFTSGVLPLKTLRDDIKNAYAGGRLIALLDCCHVAASRHDPRLQRTSLPHAVAAEDVMKQGDLFEVSDHVLLAARPGMEAYQMRVGKLWHGALTFALVTAAERWKGEDQMSHGSYKHVLKRARSTLKALGVPQKPELRVPAVVRAVIKESPFLGVKPGLLVKKPDAVLLPAQLTPDFRYTINAISKGGEVLIAVIFATNDASVSVNNKSLPTNKESWYVAPDALTNLESADDVTITATKLDASYDIDPKLSQTFTSAEVANWSQPIPLPDGKNHFFDSAPANPQSVNPLWVVLTILSTSGIPSLAHVQWWIPEAPGGGTFSPGDGAGTRYSRSATAPPGTDARAASR